MYSGVRLALPLLFAVLAALISYRVGVFNVALEGFIMAGAFTHVVSWEFLKYTARFTVSGALLGAFLIAILVGAGLGACFGVLIARGLEPITTGIALNMAVFGAIRALEKTILDPMIQSYGSSLDSAAIRASGVTQPAVVFGYLAAVLVAVLGWIYAYTPVGRQSVAAGRPDGGAEALRQAGRGVAGLRIGSSIWTGMLSAVAGITLIWLTGAYTRDMSAG